MSARQLAELLNALPEEHKDLPVMWEEECYLVEAREPKVSRMIEGPGGQPWYKPDANGTLLFVEI